MWFVRFPRKVVKQLLSLPHFYKCGQLYCKASTELTYLTFAFCSHSDMFDTIALTHVRKELGTCSLPY